jgi:chemotaxis signal transduction protein
MNRFGLFCHQAENFAIPLVRLRKILQGKRVYLLPQLPVAVPGVLVDADQIIPVFDLHRLVDGGAGTTQTEFLVLVESEFGVLAIPADVTCGIVAEQKGSTARAVENSAVWVTGQFHFQDKVFQILDIDFLAKVLVQSCRQLKSDTAGVRRHQ